MTQAQHAPAGTDAPQTHEYDVIIVGAGFAGMYQLYRIRELGMSVRVFETGDGVGGTWYWNRYPGARVDGQSLQYSYSFSSDLQQEWDWPEFYSPQPVLERYANHVADRFNLRPDIQFETRVTSTVYDENASRWIIGTDRGDLVSAKYVITAVGCLSATNVPAFKGLDNFEGDWYHTSRYPKDGVDLTGRRVGVVGTGSTGIQVVPVVAQSATHLHVFQRTPNYSLPSQNKHMDSDFQAEWKRSYDAHRAAQKISRGGSEVMTFPDWSALEVSDDERERIFEEAWGNHVALLSCFNDIGTNLEANNYAAEFVRTKIRQTVKNQEVAELLCPKDYPIGTKRICLDTGYFETYNRDNVTLVDVKTNPIVEITPKGIRTTAADYDLDVIIFATGFDAMTGPLFRMGIVGKGGQSLKEKWEAGPRTYLGLATAGFPNMYMITGPGSPSVLSTMTTSIEQHVDWITDSIKYMRDNDLHNIEAKVDAEDNWVNHVNEVADKTLYKRANSWYMGANIPGKPRVFMPYIGGVGTYRTICDDVAAEHYDGFELTR